MAQAELSGSRPIRLLGLDAEGVTDHRRQDSRNSRLYRALEANFDVIGSTAPNVGRRQDLVLRAASFAPDRYRWSQRYHLGAATYRRRSAVLHRELVQRRPSYDVLLQLYALWGPGIPPPAPHFMYLDNTAMLSARYWPKWVPLSRRGHEQRLAAERETYHHATGLFAMSEMVKESLLHDYGCAPERVVTVGAGTNVYAETIEGKDYSGRTVVFAGVGDPERKGVDLLCAAWAGVVADFGDARLKMVGLERPRSIPAQVGVEWMGRLDGSAAVAEVYRTATLFVLPSRWDPFPHVLREAMGHGLPCVATDHGAIAEIVPRNEAGILVPSGDASALAQAMKALLASPARAQEMGRVGYEHVRATASWEAVAERMRPHLAAAGGR